MTDARREALAAFQKWYAGLKVYKQNNFTPARGAIGAALLILEQLKDSFVLDLAHYRAGGGSQLKKVSGKAVQKLLAQFGETRTYLEEGGRTNRGGPNEIEMMLNAIKTAIPAHISKSQRRTPRQRAQVPSL